jgi:ribosomal protein S8
MKILALEKELDNARTIDFRKNAKAEAKALWQLYIKGIVSEFYFRKEKNLAVLVLEVKNKQTAKRVLSKLPYVSKKLIEFELIPLKPYPGFKRLFE